MSKPGFLVALILAASVLSAGPGQAGHSVTVYNCTLSTLTFKFFKASDPRLARAIPTMDVTVVFFQSGEGHCAQDNRCKVCHAGLCTTTGSNTLTYYTNASGIESWQAEVVRPC